MTTIALMVAAFFVGAAWAERRARRELNSQSKRLDLLCSHLQKELGVLEGEVIDLNEWRNEAMRRHL